MKFLHISDLHIGKKLGNYSLENDQKYILKQILEIVEKEKPDALLIAGDVYDKSMPSGDAVTIFDDFLVALSKLNCKTLIVSGNHDSAERLAFANRLIEQTGIYLSSVYDGNTRCITLNDEHGPVNVYMLPFIKPITSRKYHEDAEINSYTDLLQAAVNRMNIDPAQRNVLVAHQFVSGATVSGSEETIVGGLDNVSPEVFSQFDYVALGHIHGAQNVTERMRYCGTPLKYSLAEINSNKSVTVVELGTKNTLNVREIPLKPQYDMKAIEGSFEDIISRNWYENADFCNDYLHIVLTDTSVIPNAIGRLSDHYPRILDIQYQNVKLGTGTKATAADVDHKTAAELIADFFKLQTDKEMTEDQKKLIDEILGENNEGDND